MSHTGETELQHADAAVLPTSFAQQRFWLLDQIQPGAAVYTVPLAYRLEGPLDADVLERALNLVIDRHEILRTVFALEDEAPVQVVLPEFRLALGRVEAADHEAVRRHLLDEANRPFDLARGPLIRATLYRVSAADHVLNLSLHHIIADGWSLGILFADLALAYEAAAAGKEPRFADLALQYADFAVWQRQAAEQGAVKRQIAWWQERLKAPLPVLELATDRPRPLQPTFNGARSEAVLPADLVDQVRALARGHGATPFMAFLAAFQALLARMSRQDEVVVGSITSGRHRPETQPLIGPFVNTLAIRSAVPEALPFTGFLDQVRNAAIDALANQDAPFEMVIEALGLAWDRSRTPVFQAAFQLLEGMDADLALAGLRATRVRAAKDSAKFELTLMLTSLPDGGLRASFEYNTDLYDAATIARFLARYRRLLESVVSHPATPLGQLSILPDDERALVLDRWNATGSGTGRAALLHSDFERNVATRPEAVAVRWDDGAMSYATLDRRANHLAARLAEAGVGPDVPVGIVARNSPEALTAIIAVLKAGGCYVPIDPHYPADRIAFMLEDSGARAVIGDLAAGPMPGPEGILALDLSLTRAGEADLPPAPAAGPDHLAYIIYTSGSTGRPKGVMVAHRSVVNARDALQKDHAFGPSDVVLQTYPMVFDPSVWVYFVTLSAGGTVALPKPGSDGIPSELLDTVARLGVTVVPLVPALLQLLTEADHPERAAGVTRMFCGGEALPGDVLRRARALWPNLAITNLYGPTEATIYATQWTWDESVFEGAAPIGRPIHRCRTYILESSGQAAPIGVAGELCIAGAGVARGYLNRPDLNPQKFGADPLHAGDRVYRTGDLVRWRADGVIEFLGRLDDQVKIRGFRIELGEIESALAAIPGVRAAVAMVRADRPGEPRLAAYIVIDPGAPAAQAIRDALRGRLPEYMIPAAITVLDALPLTPNGKVDRKALPEPAGTADDRIIEPAANEDEAHVAGIMATVLSLETVGRTEDFFRLGGHSLIAMRMVARLRQRFGAAATIQAVFDHSTPARLAAHLRGSGAAEPAVVIPRRANADSSPLSFAQELIWVQSEMDRTSTAYNIPVVRRITGPFDPTSWQTALDAGVSRHPTLRSVVRVIDGEAHQAVQPPRPVPVEVVDLRQHPDPEAEATARIRAAANVPFDLGADLLLRSMVCRLDDRTWLVLLLVHHIAVDGASNAILWDTLVTTYDAARRGTSVPVPSTPIEYGDYAAWQRQRFEGVAQEQMIGYWRDALAGTAALLDLPTDRPRPKSPFGPGGQVVRTIPRDIADRMAPLADELGVTPFMLLSAAWHALLHRYSGEADMVVGTPVGGRPTPETETLVGNFVNTVLLRSRIDGDPAFRAFVTSHRTQCLAAFDHAELPLERLAAALRATGTAIPRLQTMFVLQNNVVSLRAPVDCSIEPARVHTGASQFDLSLSATMVADGLRLTLEFRTDLFDPATIDRAAGHFQSILEAVVQDPSTPVSRLPLLRADERNRILAGFNDTARPYPLHHSLAALMAEQAARTPGAVAVTFERQVLTYGQLHTRARRLASRLNRAGARPNGLVGVCAERSIELVVGLVGVLTAGAAYVPLDPDYPVDRLRYMLEDAAPPVLLTQRHLLPTLAGYPGTTICLDDGDGEGSEPSLEATLPVPNSDDLAYMIYTSGSTGRPKGALNAHRGIVNRLLWMQEAYQLTAADTVLQKTPFSFDVSVWEFFWPLITGARLVVAKPGGHRDPAYLAALIQAESVTVTHFVPSMLRAFLAEPNSAACRTLRDIMCSGEALPADLAVACMDTLPARLHNLYGPTEAAVDVTAWTCPQGWAGPSVPIGRPIANTQMYVLDHHGAPQPIGIPGELFIGGVQVGRGYWNQPDLTVEKFVPDPFRVDPGATLYRTGDRARWLNDGTIEFLGRLDFQVKLRGLRIELGEVEAAMAQSAGVGGAVVLLREDRPGDQYLAGYYTTAIGATTDPASLRRDLERQLPAHMIPTRLIHLPSFPVTPNGKLDRRALPAPAAGAPRQIEAPQTPEEKLLRRLWAQVLQHTDIDRNDSFFDLGGHSLLAVRLAAEASKIFRFPVSVRVLFDHPTLAAMAEGIGQAAPKPGQARKVAELVLRIEAERAAATGGAS